MINPLKIGRVLECLNVVQYIRKKFLREVFFC